VAPHAPLPAALITKLREGAFEGRRKAMQTQRADERTIWPRMSVASQCKVREEADFDNAHLNDDVNSFSPRRRLVYLSSCSWTFISLIGSPSPKTCVKCVLRTNVHRRTQSRFKCALSKSASSLTLHWDARDIHDHIIGQIVLSSARCVCMAFLLPSKAPSLSLVISAAGSGA
jgi:hypothetical protein